MKPYHFIFIVITYFGCKTQEFNLNSYKGEILSIGSGGGFTGTFTTYYITEEGDVFRNGMSDTSYIAVGKIKPTLIHQQFESYKKLGFTTLKHNDPGNRYYYMSLGTKDAQNKLQWGGGDLKNETLPIFHKNIMELIKRIETN